jgi:ethanolamine utilization protein EutN
MRLGHVIGRVTLSHQDPAYKGGRFLLVQPFDRSRYERARVDSAHPESHVPSSTPLPKGNSLVVYDNLGADLGHVIGYIEGSEATAPFAQPTPVDAFNAAIIDQIFYTPPG